MKIPGILSLLALAACASSRDPRTEGPADVIVHHAKIYTVDREFSTREAMAVKGGRVVAVGEDEEIFRWKGPATRVIDAEGYPVLPGLYDSHVHIVGAATSELTSPIPDLRTLEDGFSFIRERAKSLPEGQWVVLRYAFPTRLRDARFPTRAELDAAAPRHPVRWNAGPADMVNSKALEVSGITRDTPNPPTGIIVKDASGEPTGMLRGAGSLLKIKLPDDDQGGDTAAARRAAVKKLLAMYNEEGITSVADRNSGREALDLLLSLEKAGELTVRINVARSFTPSGTREEIIQRLEALPGPDKRGGPTGAGTEWVRIGPIKLFLDGGMLLGTAYMREPWPPGPTYQITETNFRGILNIQPEQLEMIVEEAARRGWQMTAHTAGEAGMDVLLDAYQAVHRKVRIDGLRFCITHANFPSERNLEICRRLNVCADVQPAWLYKDGSTLYKMLGERRIRWFQPYKTWLKYTTLGGGSDHMIKLDSLRATNPWNPWLGMWVVLSRKTEGGIIPNPEEALTREEAVRLYTINNAYLHNEEGEKGSLEVGKLADFIIIDRDIMSCPVSAVLDTRVLGTFVGGKQVFPKE